MPRRTDEPRNRVRSVRLTEQESDQIDELRGSESFSDFVRKVALALKPRRR